MRILLASMVVWLVGAMAGCRRDGPRSREETLNSPRSPREAQALMLDVDRKGAELGWSADLLRHVRQAMRGRLLAAGLTETQVEDWIQSVVTTHQENVVNGKEQNR